MLDVGVYATIYTVLSQILMINLNSIIIQNTTYILVITNFVDNKFTFKRCKEKYMVKKFIDEYNM